MEIPTIVDMLKAGMHFGHQPTRRHPKMANFIFGIKSGLNIIDLEKTVVQLKKALDYVRDLSNKNATLLFLGTKAQARDIVAKYAKECQMPYISERWLGGTITNFSEIKKVINKFRKLKREKASGELKKYTKKEQLEITREINKLETMVGGVENLEKIPDAVFIIDIKKEKTALTECNKMGVPVVAICDTNVNPEKVNHPIPANDDAMKSIELLTKLVSQAVINGQSSAKKDNKKEE